MTYRVLVTGGAGYIGSVLCPYLLRKGYEVTVLDDFSRGAQGMLRCCGFEGFKVIRGSVLDEPLMRTLIAEADAVVVLAALVGRAGEADAGRLRRVSVVGAELIAKFKRPGQSVAFPNTTAGYANLLEIDELTSMVGHTPYAEAKIEAERILLGVGAVSLRLASVFGVAPVMRTDSLLNALVKDAVEKRVIEVFEPDTLRNFVHIKDVVRLFALVTERHWEGMVSGRAYNVGLPCVTKRDLATMISTLTGCRLVFGKGSDPDKRNGNISTRRIERELYFYPKRTVADGVRELVKAYEML